MNDGFLYNGLGDGGYTATHRGAPHQIAKRVTPNIEKKEGERFGPFVPAPFLPSIRLEPMDHLFFVIPAGAPCSVIDTGFAVPSGYKKLIANGKGQGPQYNINDVTAGVKNAMKAYAAVDEYVVDAMIDAGFTVGNCIGIASYDVFMQLNSDPHNPATYVYHNFNKQNSFAILTNYLLEFPIEPLKRTAHTFSITMSADATELELAHNSVVGHHVAVTVNGARVEDFTFVEGTPDKISIVLKNGDIVKVSYLFEEDFYATPFPGMTTWIGNASMTGLVTFNEDSKFVIYEAPAIDGTDAGTIEETVTAAIAAEQDIVGIVTKVDTDFPKQMLNLVKTAYDGRLNTAIINPETGEYTDGTGLDRMPGSATDGVPHMIQYAGGDNKTGVVTFKLKL